MLKKKKQKLAIIEASNEYIGLNCFDSSIQFINPAVLGKMLELTVYELWIVTHHQRERMQQNFPDFL
jgi:hypothetical protein